MISECINELNSNDYTEFIFRDGVFARNGLDLSDYCITTIDEKWSVISVRNDDVGRPEYESFGYSVQPLIYGLTDIGAVNATGVLRIREQPVLGLTGAGTCIAVIDTGINWRHLSFVNKNNTSKIRVLWDQETDRIYDTDMINRSLASQTSDIPGDEIGHGTYTAGIACGNVNSAVFFSGVAPGAELIVVKVKQAKQNLRDFYYVKDGVPAYSEVDIMRGLNFVKQYAKENGLPVSIIIGFGTSLGSHSGASPLSNMIADISGQSGTCVTLSAGNEGGEGLHFSGRTEGNVPARSEIRIGRNVKGFTANVWSKAPYVFTVEIISPSGQVVGRIPARNETTRLVFPFEDTVIYVYYRRYESVSGANLITLRFDAPAEGIWVLNFYNNTDTPGDVDAWIMNRSLIGEEVFFLTPDVYTTITDPGNLAPAITVTAYDYRDNSLYGDNGRGNNWYGIIKPDFAAPGVDITVPSYIGDNRYDIRSGTSIAAGFYGGMASLFLEYGIIRGNIPYIGTNEIRNITIDGCEQLPGIPFPNREWGYGRVNIYNSIEKIRE
jgi:subtilisin family serine protease